MNKRNPIRRVLAAALLALLSLLPSTAVLAQTPYLGEIRCGIWNFAPRGWTMLQGQLLPINQNQALFALLGTQFGGDGRVNFALPDMRSRILLTQGAGQGLTLRTIGETGGAERHTMTVAEMPQHTHAVTLQGAANAGDSQSPAGRAQAVQARTTLYAAPPANPGAAMAPAAVSSTGGNQPLSTMQPYVTLTCVIATQGIFPSRD